MGRLVTQRRITLLRGVAVLTREVPGQAHELRTSGLPPSDEPQRTQPTVQVGSEFTRYVADAGAAYVDVVLRGIFALKPTWAVNTPTNCSIRPRIPAEGSRSDAVQCKNDLWAGKGEC